MQHSKVFISFVSGLLSGITCSFLWSIMSCVRNILYRIFLKGDKIFERDFTAVWNLQK